MQLFVRQHGIRNYDGECRIQWYYSLLVSLTVYTGAYQFVLVTLLSSGASILTMALTAFLMNSRQSFYALTFVDEFNHMGKRKLYMIHTMTDETYAVNCTLPDTGKENQSIMFWVAFCRGVTGWLVRLPGGSWVRLFRLI